MLKCRIWSGIFKDGEIFEDYFKEQYEREDKPISKFAEGQGEIWLDHDFFEFGFENHSTNLRDKFSQYSFSDDWTDEFQERVKEIGVVNANTIVISVSDNGKFQISVPKSIHHSEFTLHYLGEF